MIIADTHNGQLRIQGNEVIIDAKDDDASKFRVGSRSGGAFSFDKISEVSEGNHRTEVAVLAGGFNGRAGEVGMCVWDGTDPITDASQKKVVEFFHDHIEFKVPITAPNLGTAGPGTVSRLASGNGRYVVNVQDDGRIVQYDTHDTPDETQWTVHRILV